MATMLFIRLAVTLLAARAVTANAPAGGPAKVDPNETAAWKLLRGMVWAWLVIIGILFAYTISLHFIHYVRTVSCLNNDTQRFFARPTYTFGNIKRYIIDAPLFRTRHHREFKLSSAINVGTLPSRLQTIFLVAYVTASIFMTCIGIKWSAPRAKVLYQLIIRTGLMAIMNMLPLFLLAGRNNPLIKLTGITFDTYNLIHRWLGRIVVVEAVIHGTGWMVNKVAKGEPNTQSALPSQIC
jgi:hypothetical protein